MSTELNLEEIEARCRLAELSEGEMYYAEAAASIVETDVPALCREIRALRNWQNRAADAIRAYRNYTTLAENWNNEEETFRLLSELEGGK